MILQYPDGERKTYPAAREGEREREREYDLIHPPHRERRLKIDRASGEGREGARGERKRMDLGQAECSASSLLP